MHIREPDLMIVFTGGKMAYTRTVSDIIAASDLTVNFLNFS